MYPVAQKSLENQGFFALFPCAPGERTNGIPVLALREPGAIHRARLGSIEINVFSLIGSRIKDGRACRGVDGAKHLAVLFCQRHTVGFENLFA